MELSRRIWAFLTRFNKESNLIRVSLYIAFNDTSNDESGSRISLGIFWRVFLDASTKALNTVYEREIFFKRIVGGCSGFSPGR